MSGVKALATLLRVKRRRVEQAEAHVKTCVQALRDREAECERAREQLEACRGAERDCDRKIAQLCTESFLSSDLIALQHVLERLRADTAQAGKAVASAEQKVQAAQQAVVEARRAVQKAQAVVEFLEKRREELLREMENARDELQDEESEEAAVARMLAAAKADAEAVA